jgi:hypothetical protein
LPFPSPKGADNGMSDHSNRADPSGEIPKFKFAVQPMISPGLQAMLKASSDAAVFAGLSRKLGAGLSKPYLGEFSKLAVGPKFSPGFQAVLTRRFGEAFRQAAGVDTRRFALAAGVDTRRFGEAFRQAAGVDTRRFALAAGVDTRRFGEAFSLMSVEITAAALVQPVDEVSPREAALARALGVDPLFIGQLTLRALVLAIFLTLVIAVWEEQRESAPAQALLEIVGAFGLWYGVDGAIWKKLS